MPDNQTVNLGELHTEQLKDHEQRIQKLEREESVLSTKIDTTNKILITIAVMIGGGICTILFNLLTHGIQVVK